mgnify:CR=1
GVLTFGKGIIIIQLSEIIYIGFLTFYYIAVIIEVTVTLSTSAGPYETGIVLILFGNTLTNLYLRVLL